MEVADQWQREWAGTAEYGKVTEGGVTRRIARAMEVLHTSGPGARVRVLRAAYHSSAGPGVPASSYMLHSSRRVITSGFNFMEPPSLPSIPSKPLEISSTSLDSSPDSHTETENYKVTEPDDLEISEPSKWRGSSGINSIRMPSEESSSADNASIIDLDVRTNKGLHRKYSYDSESSDNQWNKNSARSPFLDAPITLNTLKYKSLLNNSWNNRRKSYSFEDTSSMGDDSPFKNDTIAMESSTDSGICKSSEIVNDATDDSSHSRTFDHNEKKSKIQDESFQEWLSKNRLNSFYKGTKFKSDREHNTVIEHPSENKAHNNNIIIQSTGKVSITLPVTIEADDNSQHKKVKKVEFCKTELHVAVDTGEVNIISTDDKPPPSNDFRKRRSAFVPMLDVPEKSITLFGDKFIDSSESIQVGDMLKRNNGDVSEIDENTAATKSILKNKIPKPKPYLLGENMAFGSTSISNETGHNENFAVQTAVSLINKQLEAERRYSDELLKSNVLEQTNSSVRKTSAFRTIDEGPNKDDMSDTEDTPRLLIKSDKPVKESIKVNHVNSIKDKFYALQTSPTQSRSKTRQLRQSELSYFGIDNHRRKNIDQPIISENVPQNDSAVENIFHSVKLVKKISNSVCSSEAESEDTPQYQNVPLNTTYTPVPTPRLHSKHDIKPNKLEPAHIVKNVVDKDREGSDEISVPVPITRRPRLRKQEDHTTPTSRSLSEPPKGYKYNSLDKTHRSNNQSTRTTKYANKSGNENHKLRVTKVSPGNSRKIEEDPIPIYVNLDDDVEPVYQVLDNRTSSHRRSLRDSVKKIFPKKHSHKTDNYKQHSRRISHENDYAEIERLSDNENDSFKKTQRLNSKSDTLQKLVKNEQPRFSRDCRRETDKRLTTSQNIKKSTDNKKSDEDSMSKLKHGYRSLSSQRNGNKTSHEDSSTKKNGNLSRTDNKTVTPIVENIMIRQKKHSNDKHTSKNEPSQQKQHIRDNNNTPSTSLQIKSDAKHSTYINSNTKSSGQRTSRRNEYVINYDDKKGTVSSVCKIKTGPGGTRTKKVSSEMIGEKPTETVVRHKAINRIALRK
ncbi:hypothetical protein O3G_MSEX006120 [Manduca sexta]|uniref:Uncharacterized protein n=1 Tax=Manduca sexta TaxID=7130 RepID=A0A921Z127_MANSE|nr:hypothetical protein O3G_MSEX006120 [Manduca sexta]